MPESDVWQVEVRLLRSWYEREAGEADPQALCWTDFQKEYARLRISLNTAGGDGSPLRDMHSVISRLAPLALAKVRGLTFEELPSRGRT